MVSKRQLRHWAKALRRDVRGFQSRYHGEREQLQALELEFNVLHTEGQVLRTQLAAARRDADLPLAVLERQLRGTVNVEDVLRIAVVVSEGAMRALPSAYAAARRASALPRGRLSQLGIDLLKLAGPYRDCMRQGDGDRCGVQVFGAKRFAAKESATARSNERAIAERTFEDRAETRVMMRHLKIGPLRVYFDWDHEAECVVIGHCGDHLYLP
jgi:hypothetical protein